MKPISYFILILTGLLASCLLNVSATKSWSESMGPERINFDPNRPAMPGEILVKFKPGTFRRDPIQVGETVQTSQASVNALLAQLRVKSMARVFRGKQALLGDIYRLRFEAPITLPGALQQMGNNPNVEWVEPNYFSFISDTPDDTYFPQQWGLTKVQADLAWDISHGSTDIVIAVIDTGVDHNHLDLEDNIWHNPGEIPRNELDDDGNGYVDDDIGWDFVSATMASIPAPYENEDVEPPDRDPMDFHGHGTGCAGIASAVTNNSRGVAGTAWNCKIMALRAGYKTEDSNGTLLDSDSSAALEYAADNGAHVISMSWGGGGSRILRAAIEYAYNAGCILVAAAGNEGNHPPPVPPHYPATYPDVIAVAASDENDDRASFSSYGPWVHIAAPGTSIYSTTYRLEDHNDTYGLWNGTSMSTPIVAGAAALILSQNPTLMADTVLLMLLDSGDDIEWIVDESVVEPTKRLNIYEALLLGVPTNIRIYMPGSGELIRGGETYNITWRTTGYDIDHIHLQYHIPDWADYQDIVASTSDNGSYEWLAPSLNSSAVRMKAIAEDAEGNSLAEFTTGEFTIDSDPPQTIAKPYGTTGEDKWYKSDVYITLSATDSLSGVKEIRYKMNDNPWELYSDILVATSSTAYHYYSEDNVGNVEAEESIVIKIDKDPPITSLALNGTPGYNEWYISDVLVTLSASDYVSGVKDTKYRSGVSWTSYTEPFSVASSAIYYYYSEDNAGNAEAEKSVEINVDKAAPITSVYLDGAGGDGEWFTSDVIVYLSAADEASGLKEIRYRIDDGDWEVYTEQGIEITGTRHVVSLHYQSVDNAGNLELSKSVDIKIDKTAPSTPVVEDGEFTNFITQFHASWTAASDAESGVVEYLYSIGMVPDGSGFENWTFSGAETDLTITGLSLVWGQTYYLGVRAKNGAGIYSDTGISDGIYVNAIPVVADIPDVSFPEDESDNSIDLDEYVNDFNDADSEINWTYTGNDNVKVNMSATTNVVTLTADPNWSGSETITFTATDPWYISDSGAMTVNVIPVNDPPTANSLRIEPVAPGLMDDLNALYTYTDVEGDAESSQIRWYRGHEHQPGYDNQLIIPSSATLPGEGWYFTVTPGDGTDFGETKTSLSVTIGGVIQELHLYPGWNLFSIYPDVANTDLPSVLAPIEGLYGVVCSYDASSGGWKRYIAHESSESISDLHTLEPRKGYWINMSVSEEVILTITGEEIPDRTVQLSTGWNLIGYTSTESTSLENIPFSRDYTSIWTYDSAGGIWLRHVAGNPGSANNLSQLEPGRGYWIYVEEN
jgi:hypothetical protein